jgi:predicted component of type VI protein secretion system
MAYLVFSSHKGEEIGRRRLDGPLTIGRSPDCDVSLHDILLSRRHCRLEPSDKGWVVTDLGSRNGTVVHGRTVSQHVLNDGESFLIGRVKARFRSGVLAAGQQKTVTSGRPQRPADPFDAMSGTVAGFRYEPPAEEKHVRDVEQFPSPKPVKTDSGRFVAVTDSGRFVGVTDDVWINDKGEEASPGILARDDHAEKKDPDADRRPVVRPKAPQGELPTVGKVQFPGPPPKPPRRRTGLRRLFQNVGRRMRRPFARWAAVLIALGGIGAAIFIAM